jgi:hypothetical protein
MGRTKKNSHSNAAVADNLGNLPLFSSVNTCPEINWDNPAHVALLQVFLEDLFPEDFQLSCDRIELHQVCAQFSRVLELWVLRCPNPLHTLFFALTLILCRIHRRLTHPIALGDDRWHLLIRQWDAEECLWRRYQIPGQWSRQEAAYLIQALKGSFKWWLSCDPDDDNRPVEDDCIHEYLKEFCKQQRNGEISSMNNELY